MEGFLLPERLSKRQGTCTSIWLIVFIDLWIKECGVCILTGCRYRDHWAVLIFSRGTGDLQSEFVQCSWFQTFHNMLCCVSPRRQETRRIRHPVIKSALWKSLRAGGSNVWMLLLPVWPHLGGCQSPTLGGGCPECEGQVTHPSFPTLPQLQSHEKTQDFFFFFKHNY